MSTEKLRREKVSKLAMFEKIKFINRENSKKHYLYQEAIKLQWLELPLSRLDHFVTWMPSVHLSSALHDTNLIILFQEYNVKSSSSIQEKSMTDMAFAASEASYQFYARGNYLFSSQRNVIRFRCRFQAKESYISTWASLVDHHSVMFAFAKDSGRALVFIILLLSVYQRIWE